jgi:hypothetical protein
VLHGIKKERNILRKIERKYVSRVGHIFCRNCILKHILVGKIEARIEGMGRRGRRRKPVLDNLREKQEYWKLKDE